MRISKPLLMVLASVVLVSAVVAAITIFSVTVQRQQTIALLLSLEVTPDPFPELLIQTGTALTQSFTAVATNPVGNSFSVDITVTLTLTTACAFGSITVTSTGTPSVNLCTAPWVSSTTLTAPGATATYAGTLTYSLDFSGLAVFDFLAEGVEV